MQNRAALSWSRSEASAAASIDAEIQAMDTVIGSSRPAHPRPRPAGLPEHPRGHRHTGQRTETLKTRPWQATRLQNNQPVLVHEVDKTIKREKTLAAPLGQTA
ncbi:hypothetical protein K8Z49_37695 [Actinomadura madurae]|uniref:hypothetical protein n=1 Tax=Actinomadura madurae TaxID=1993 RepID=UPI00399A64F9